jgi:hypothetical protein
MEDILNAQDDTFDEQDCSQHCLMMLEMHTEQFQTPSCSLAWYKVTTVSYPHI